MEIIQMRKVQVLVATMNQNDFTLAERMNIVDNAIIANQAANDSVFYDNKSSILFITSNTRGVGTNRNIALDHANADIVMFADDDLVLDHQYVSTVMDEFEKTKADVIVFNFRYHLPDGTERDRISERKRLNLMNAMRFGTCALAIDLRQCRINNLHFSTLFGGGSLYGCGEDSLFLLDCLRSGLKVYASTASVGDNYNYGSSWFTGYNDKYFYDKGAWIACAFPHMRSIMKIYYIVRFSRISDCSIKQRFLMLTAGIKNYKNSIGYQEYITNSRSQWT